MALFNYASKEITLKIVYYGPGLCGKTTNLQRLHATMSPEKKSKLLSLSTESDRTLFFDFMPVALGKIKDFDIKFQLYTVPGQVRYNATRKLVLKGADAVVFVADSQTAMKEANIESLQNMRENLLANNIKPDDIPLVLQYNKRDLSEIMSVEEIDGDLNPIGDAAIEAAAINGMGVEDTFKEVTHRLLKNISKKHNVQITPPQEEVAEQPKPQDESFVLERAGVDDSVVNISVQGKSDLDFTTASESEMEENLLRTSMPEGPDHEEPLEWRNGSDIARTLVEEEEGPEGDDLIDTLLKTPEEREDDIAEVEALDVETSSEEAALAGSSDVLREILHELRESRKQQAEILSALRDLGRAFSERDI